MNAQERTLLTDLLNKLQEAARSSTGLAKDPEADRLIKETLSATPDAAYLLVQRHLLLEMALERAQAQIKALQAAAGGSFLGGPATPDIIPQNAQTNAYGQPIGRAEPASAPAAPAHTSAATARSNFGGGSFLGTAAATATGVLGGALLFQGIEHLMGGPGFGSGNELNDRMMAGTQPVEDVTNISENFYGVSPDTALGQDAGGWDNAAMNDDRSVFDGPAANSVDPSEFDNGGLFDQADAGDSGGGLFDGLFDDGDDDWV